MKCGLVNSLNSPHFKASNNEGIKNAPLSFEPIVPTSNLPNTSLFEKINSNQTQIQKIPHDTKLSKEEKINTIQSKSGGKYSLGKLSANFAALGMLLSAVSLLFLIRKK